VLQCETKKELPLGNSLIMNVGPDGLEPSTTWLWVRCSNQSKEEINFYLYRIFFHIRLFVEAFQFCVFKWYDFVLHRYVIFV